MTAETATAEVFPHISLSVWRDGLPPVCGLGAVLIKGVDVLELTVDGHKIRYALRAGTARWCGKNLEEEGLAQT